MRRLCLAIVLMIVLGWAAYKVRHPSPPTAAQIVSCKRSYGCNLDDLLRLPQ